MRLIHPHDAQAPFVAVRKSPFIKYNPFNSLTHSASDSHITRAVLLDNKIMLKVSSSLKPIPMCCFAFVTISYRVQCIFLPESDPPHQKLAIKAFISKNQDFKNFRTLMAYEGMTVITAFMSTSCPTLFRVCAFHPCSLYTMHFLNNREPLFLISLT